MTNLTGASTPLTQKAQRKAAAADANNSKVFRQTEFGRKRIRPKILLRLIVPLGIAIAFVYRFIRGSK